MANAPDRLRGAHMPKDCRAHGPTGVSLELRLPEVCQPDWAGGFIISLRACRIVLKRAEPSPADLNLGRVSPVGVARACILRYGLCAFYRWRAVSANSAYRARRPTGDRLMWCLRPSAPVKAPDARRSTIHTIAIGLDWSENKPSRYTHT